MKYYTGKRTKLGPEVYVVNRNKVQPLRHVCLHSPDGFEWGYGGSGPADLALSILTDAVGPEGAQDLYQRFKWDVISSLLHEGWKISEQEIREWLKAQEAKNGMTEYTDHLLKTKKNFKEVKTMSTNSTALTISTSLPIVTASNEEHREMLAIMQENLQGMPFKFDRVKIPAAGGLAFTLTGALGNPDGKPKSAEALVGVILYHHMVNAFWRDRFSGGNNPPDCSAIDGETGIGDPGGLCIKCPNNQWGTARDDKGNFTKGKACKNIRRVYLLTEESYPYPILFPLPPTSLQSLANYMKRLCTGKPVPYYGCWTKVTLEQAQNQGGITYSKAVFTRVGDIEPAGRMRIKAWAESLKPVFMQQKIEAIDYEAEAEAEVANGNAGQNLPPTGTTGGEAPLW